MTLSPTERNEVVKLVAAAIVNELRDAAGGDFGNLIVLPMSAVAPLVGLSATTAALKLPVTETSAGKHGVTLGNIKAYVAAKTRLPKSCTKVDV